MGDIKQIRILRLFIVLLLLCNMGLVATLWLKGSRGPHERGESTRAYVIRALKFTPGQVAQYDVLIHEHQKGMNEQRRLAHGYRNALFGGLRGDKPDVACRDSLVALIAAAQRQIEVVTFDHFARVRTLCTPGQRVEFDRIITDVVQRMGGIRLGPGDRDRGEGPPPGERGDMPPGGLDGPGGPVGPGGPPPPEE
jgi:protein CpxP